MARLLIVDDLPCLAQLLFDAVSGAGHSAEIANSSEQAIGLAGCRRFDLALVDVVLRGEEQEEEAGIRLAARLMHDFHLHSLFVTSAGFKVRRGVDGCGTLGKPFATLAAVSLAADAVLAMLETHTAPTLLPPGLYLWPPLLH